MNPTQSAVPVQPGNPRKKEFLEYAEASLSDQDSRGRFNAAYREDDRKFMRFLIPPGKRVLELGCGRGELLAALEPSYGVGVDFGPRTVARAKELHPHLHFVLGDAEDPATLTAIEGPFDYIVIADTIGMFEDIDGTLKLVHHLCAPSTRIIISYYSHLWEPILKLAEAAAPAAASSRKSTTSPRPISCNLMDLADFEVISQEQRQLMPRRWFGLGPFINRYIAPLPGIRQLCLRTYIVGRPVRQFPDRKFSASILIPCRNEKGNIENAILRMPRFGCRPGNPVRRRQFQRRHLRGMRARSRCLQGHLGHQGAEAGRQGQGRRGAQGLCRGDRRRADDPRRRPDDAAGSAAEISCGDRDREGRVRQRHPADLSDGKRGDAPAQPDRQPLLCLSVQLSREYAG